MDAGNGSFVTAPTVKDLIEKHPNMREAYEDGQHIFQVGQELEIKGSMFKIMAIGKKFMRLKLLPKRG